jgi:hypothetical protein
LWGRLSFEAKINGGKVAVAARSGNLDQPQKNWSAFSPPITEPKGGPVGAPAARFVQWKATLTADGSGHSPELESVDLAYLPKNVEPRIEEIEMTPPNYKVPAPATPVVTTQQTLNLPPLGKRPAPAFTIDATTTTPTMQLAKGYVGARWLASDPNGDSLIYTVEIRGASETQRIPPARNRFGRARQSSLGGADGAHGERRVLDRQHAAEDHGPGRHARRRQAGNPLARRGRPE